MKEAETALKPSKACSQPGRILRRQKNRKNFINGVLKGTEGLLRNLWRF